MNSTLDPASVIIESLSTSPSDPSVPGSSDVDITCTEINLENDAELKTCYIEVIHNEEDCSNNFVIPQHANIPRKLFLEQDMLIPEVSDSVQCSFFEVIDSSVLTDPLTCSFRPSKDKLVAYISELKSRDSIGMKYGIGLDYGRFDLDGLKVFEEYQLKEDVINESIWFCQKDFAKPECFQEIDMQSTSEFQQWLLNFGSEDEVPLQGKISLKTHELADLACERWINDSIINYFVDLIQINSEHCYIVNFACVSNLESEVHQIKLHFSNYICNGQILFISHIGIQPDCDETFMSQEHLHTSHYAFASFLFCDSKVRYADTMGLKIPSEFIEKVNFILSYFDVEPTYHYCHDPRGTVIEDEPRFISHMCTQYCSKIYPLQTCTNVCGVALLIGMCIASASKTDFVEMCKPGGSLCFSKFAYLRNISHYSHFLRLVLMQYLVKFCPDLQVISDVRHGTEHSDNTTVSLNTHGNSSGQIVQCRRKNVLDIKYVSDLIHDAVLKYARSKDKPVMQLICRIRSSGKLVTKSFPCSPLGQDDKDCVRSIQNFMNTSNCRDWLLSYVNDTSVGTEGSEICDVKAHMGGSEGNFENNDSLVIFGTQSKSCVDSLTECIDAEPVRRNRRKNQLDISYVSDLICDAKLKFVKIKGKPALQLGCIIRASGKSITKSFPCSSLGQDDSECVARIQKFIDSDDCVEWISSYIKCIENQLYEGEDDPGSVKLSYRKNVLDIRKISHLVSDARVRFIKSKGKPCVQLLCKVKLGGKLVSKLFPSASQDQSEACSVELVQNFINSSNCETWLHSSISKNLLDTSNISSLVDSARLKYFRVKGNPVVQLLCQLKSSKRLVKKTFAFSTSGIGDSESVAEIQKYIDSASCVSWLNRCKNRIPPNSVALDISNISDLVDDAKLKFQIVNHKPAMQLICHLTSNQKSVSKIFPCSSQGYKDTECIAKVQNFVKSIDCVAWLYKHIMKNPPAESKCSKTLPLDTKRDIEKLCPSPSAESHGAEIEPLTTIKVELDPDGELVESWIDSDRFSSSSGDSPSHSLNPDMSLDILPYYESSVKLEDESVLCKHLNLKNVADFVEDVMLKAVEVNGKTKICLLFRVRYTQKLLKRYIPYSGVTKDIDKLTAEAQSFIDSKKCVKWLSRSVKDFYGKGALDIQSISDLVDYAWMKYTKLKNKPVMYLGCRITSNKKLVRKAFQCDILKECVREIQNYVDSSSCRTWLEVYSREGRVESSNIKEKIQDMNGPKEMVEVVETTDCLSDEMSSTGNSCNELNKENVSDLVDDVKLRFIKVKGKPMLQLVCLCKCTKKSVTKCFPCSPLGQKDSDCITKIQKFLNSEECTNWLERFIGKSVPHIEKASKNVYGLRNYDDDGPERHQNSNVSHLEACNAKYVENHQDGLTVSGENLLDVGNICHLIHSAKLLFVNVKQNPRIQLLCQIKSSGKLVTKSFSCSLFGLRDKDCLNKIQNFICSHECLTWLDNCIDGNSSQDVVVETSHLDAKPCQVNIVGKPEINFVKPNTLRLVCHLKNGRTKCKVFRCSSEGRNDKDAMKAISDFINSDAFTDWLLMARNKNRADDEWKFLRYLKTGIDTRNFVDSIPFDLNQNFSLNKREHYKVVIHRDHGCSKSVVESPTWGVSHRLDDTYSLKDEPLNKGTVAVYLLLSCASKTDECRTECGEPVKNVSIVGNSLSCCGHAIKGYHCTNCYTNTSPQWCRKKDSVVLCKNCDVYLRMHGTDRPQHLWKECSTANFKHLKCKWKLKLVLRTDDMSRWHVYRSVHNHQSHNTVIQERKRPGLVTKDDWRQSKSKECINQKRLDINRKQKRTEQLVELSSSYGQPKFQDSDVTVFKAHVDLKQELCQVECPDESAPYIETCEDYIHDAGVINTEEVDVAMKNPEFQYDEEENCTLHVRKKLKVERPEEEDDMDSERRDEASMVCIKCIQESIPEMFCCSSKHDLDDHIAKCHREELFACAPCYTDNNVIVTFHNESAFEEHMKLHSVKRTT